MIDYDKTVIPYLNTNEGLDVRIEKLWGHWPEVSDLKEVMRDFLSAAIISPNIEKLGPYVAHSIKVSEKCGEVGVKIIENYPFLSDFLDPVKLAFMGLIEDSFYLIGGDGSNNPNGEDSNPFHEILTYIQFSHMNYNDLAQSMALHFVAPEILNKAHKDGNFERVPVPERPNLRLDILTVVDALCTTDYLPGIRGDFENSLKFRIDDLRTRRRRNHPLVIALDEGGQNRLIETTNIIEGLVR